MARESFLLQHSRLQPFVVAGDDFLGEAVAAVLEASVAAGGGRLRGIRMYTAYAEGGLHGNPPDPALKGLVIA